MPPDKTSRTSNKREWTLPQYLFYGGLGVLAGVTSYYFYDYFKYSDENKKDEDLLSAFDSGETNKISTTSTSSIKDKRCCEILQTLIDKINFNFYRNQRISDFTAMRGFEQIKKHQLKLFDIITLTNILKNPRLSSVEKHLHFNQVKIYCFAKLMSVVYLLLCRLLLHRIQINILGRQWIKTLILTTPSIEELTESELESLYEAIQGPGTNYSKIDHVITEKNTSNKNSLPDENAMLPTSPSNMPYISDAIDDTHIISRNFVNNRKRKENYHPRQHLCLKTPGYDISIYNDAFYVILSSTKWTETYQGCADLSALILQNCDTALADVLPQDTLTLRTVNELLDDVCERTESYLFGPASDENTESDGIDSEQNSPSDCKHKLLTQLLLPDWITAVNYEETSKLSTENNKFSTPPENTDTEFKLDILSLKTVDERVFVEGCLAETRDFLESQEFHDLFVLCRKKCIDLIISAIDTKLASRTTDSSNFPLCRIFSRLCALADQLADEIDSIPPCELIQDSNGSKESTNIYVDLFTKSQEVERFCCSIYAPYLMITQK